MVSALGQLSCGWFCRCDGGEAGAVPQLEGERGASSDGEEDGTSAEGTVPSSGDPRPSARSGFGVSTGASSVMAGKFKLWNVKSGVRGRFEDGGGGVLKKDGANF